jgi:AcrR family transcriptional regulator
MASPRTLHRDRRRQRRQDAEREILEAAERLLRQRRFRDVTVDDVMAATSQSRTAFYRFFADREDLLVRLIEQIGDELYRISDGWLSGTGDPLAEARQALERMADVYEEHGRLLGAIAEAAALDDRVEAVYRGLVARFIDAAAARIERDLAAGRIQPLDARQTATAFVWMFERYLAATFGRPEPGDRASAVETLFTIWLRTLYGSQPPAAP